MFTGAQLTFGSGPILFRKHPALEQASYIVGGYTFVDALADQKAFLNSLALESALERRRTRWFSFYCGQLLRRNQVSALTNSTTFSARNPFQPQDVQAHPWTGACRATWIMGKE